MNPLYALCPPLGNVAVPSHWSFSSLSVWRKCPKRWWLTKAKYSNVNTKEYPSTVNPATFQGLLIHSVVEDQCGPTSTEAGAGPHMSLREQVRATTTTLLSRLAADNPRANTEFIRTRINLDDCVNFIKRISAGRKRSPPAAEAKGGHGQISKRTPPEGPEVWLSHESPSICGRLDQAENRGVFEYKTGQPSESHVDQLKFYALLWWLTTGERPEFLKLVYLADDTVVDVEVPSVAALEAAASSLRQELESIRQRINRVAIEAKLDREYCSFCPVRQLCEDYWSGGATLGLTGALLNAEPAESLLDVEVKQLPDAWTTGSPCIGRGHSRALGDVLISIDRTRCPEAGSPRPKSARILGARITKDGAHWRLSLSRMSEVFWKVD